MNKILQAVYVRLRDEPVLTAALVGALLVLLVQLGVPVSDGVQNAVSVLILAASAYIARRKVTPTSKL